MASVKTNRFWNISRHVFDLSSWMEHFWKIRRCFKKCCKSTMVFRNENIGIKLWVWSVWIISFDPFINRWVILRSFGNISNLCTSDIESQLDYAEYQTTLLFQDIRQNNVHWRRQKQNPIFGILWSWKAFKNQTRNQSKKWNWKTQTISSWNGRLSKVTVQL